MDRYNDLGAGHLADNSLFRWVRSTLGVRRNGLKDTGCVTTPAMRSFRNVKVRAKSGRASSTLDRA